MGWLLLTHLHVEEMVDILADNIFKWIFLNENDGIPIQFSLKFVPRSPIDNKPALVQVMVGCWSGAEPLPEPMLTQFTDAYMQHKVEMTQHIVAQIKLCTFCRQLFEMHFFHGNISVASEIQLEFVPEDLIVNMWALFEVVAWGLFSGAKNTTWNNVDLSSVSTWTNDGLDPCCIYASPGARPINDISIEFEIRPKFAVL